MWGRSMLAVGSLLLCAGCMNITASLQPENAGVPELREVSDCVPIFLGLSYGSATVEGALAQRVPKISEPYDSPRGAISKVRSIALHDYQFLFFGARCVEVVGE